MKFFPSLLQIYLYFQLIVEEFGLLDFVNQMISELLAPISKILFPEWYGSGIDSHKVSVLVYSILCIKILRNCDTDRTIPNVFCKISRFPNLYLFDKSVTTVIKCSDI